MMTDTEDLGFTEEELDKVKNFRPPMMFRFIIYEKEGQQFEDLEVKYHLFDRENSSVYSQWEPVPVMQVVTDEERVEEELEVNDRKKFH